MAAMSASAPGATTLTPPSSSHGNDPGWKSSYASEVDQVSMHDGNFLDGHETNGTYNGTFSQHDNSAHHDSYAKSGSTDPFPAIREVRTGGRSTSRPDYKRSNSQTNDAEKADPTVDSKWIHRDKLAKIESAELQAAGIVLPKPRSQSRPRRERSTEKLHSRRATDASDQPLPRTRKDSRSTSAERTPETDVGAWDLRLPEEIAEDPNEYWISSDTLAGKSTRIPIAKQSPAPVPNDYLDRDAPVPRKMSGTILPDEDFMLAASKPRSRSGSAVLDANPALQSARRAATEGSPKKTATGTRKASVTSARSASANRPKTRSGPSRDVGTATRPTTRSGELSLKAPEGDPPWMVSAYKPDPRLPPDQQLLPTVAKRLQQEKWEKEGKFGNVYDKEFRPLTDEGFSQPPELQRPQLEENQDEWPLRVEAKSPTPSRPGTSSYSTMPKIQDTSMFTPLASPRLPIAQSQPQLQPTSPITRVPTAPEPPQVSEEKPKEKKSGCGCCVVM